MSDTTPYQRGHVHSPSYNSAEGGGIAQQSSSSISHSSQVVPTPPQTPNLSRTTASPRAHSPAKFMASRVENSSGGGGGGSFSVDKIGKAIIARLVRAAKRGNLPFLVVFISCLVYFFSALAGIGYVDPETLPAATADSLLIPPAKFMPGAPVFVPDEDSEVGLRRKAEERRELEKQWQKKKRPQDGAWMQKQRDTKAIKRKPVQIPEAPPAEQYEKQPKGEIEKRDLDSLDDEKQTPNGQDGETKSNEAYDEPELEVKKEKEIVVQKTEQGISVDQAEQEEEELGDVPEELKE